MSVSENVLVAMSGGVDSSAAAALLARDGHLVTGVTMGLFGDALTRCAGHGAGEAAAAGMRSARAACDQLGIPHIALDLSERFDEEVARPFCRGYLAGLTPNPCIDCNRHLKVAALQEHRRRLGAAYVATGHYARIAFDEGAGRWQLRRGLDANKDQSYVLWPLGQDDLAHMLLPLGELAKDEVRAIAARHGLHAATAPESQDICFVPDGDYARFIERYAAERPGASLDLRLLEPGSIVDRAGKVIGSHRGIARYTIGQRKGLGIAAGAPLYVCAKDAQANTLTAAGAEATLGRRVEAHGVNMVSTPVLEGPTHVLAKSHYRQEAAPATAWQPDPDRLVIEFDEPQRLAAPGQSLVLYDGDIVLGGGIVSP